MVPNKPFYSNTPNYQLCSCLKYLYVLLTVSISPRMNEQLSLCHAIENDIRLCW